MSSSAPVSAAESRALQDAARLSLVANIVLVAIKVGAGWFSGSISVLAEGIQSLLDIFASAMILVTVRAAAAPPDRSHPWGHGKFENLTALFQMILVLGSVGGILWAAWGRWNNPSMPQVDIGIGALLISAAINMLVSSRVAAVAKAMRSAALQAEVVHLRGDLWAVGGVIIGLVATRVFQEPRLDPLCAGLMTLVSVHAAVQLIRDTLRPLLDESLPDEEKSAIQAVLHADARVLGFHKLRTRQSGSQRHADVHVMLSDELSFRASHAITEDIEDAIRAALPNLDVIVHAEPFEEEVQHRREVHGEDIPTIKEGPAPDSGRAPRQ